MPDDLTLDLDKGLRERVHAEVIRTVRRSVELCADRNALMRELRQVANCEEENLPEGPYPGSCMLTDPLTQEVCRTLEASIRQAVTDKVYLYQALKAGDEKSARIKEQWINGRMQQDGFPMAFAQSVRNACETLGGVLCADWREEYERKTEVLYRDKATGETVTEDGVQAGVDYAEERLYYEAEVTKSGVDFRSPDPWDLYTWPVSVTTLDAADRIAEYMPMTRSDLLMRVFTERFDEQAVLDAVRSGPGGTEGRDETENERQGVGTGPDSDEPFAVYRVIGRLPLLMDDETGKPVEVPEEYQWRDCVWYVCLGPDLVLKEALYRHQVRPYSLVKCYIRPNCLWGDSPASQLRPLQDQATASMRQYIDGCEQLVSPQLMVEEDFADFLDGQVGVPGKAIGIPAGAHPEPFVLNPQGPMLARETNSYVVSRAHQDFSADQASAMLAGKVRKDAEVKATQALMQSKFGIVTQNVAFALLDFLPRIEVQYLAHMGEDEALRMGGEDVQVDGDAMRSRFRVVAQVKSEATNEETRVEKDLSVLQVYMQSPIFQKQLSEGDLSGVYRLLSRTLGDMGEDPEAILGTEDKYAAPLIPTAPPIADPMQAMQGQEQGQPGQGGQKNGQQGGADQVQALLAGMGGMGVG